MIAATAQTPAPPALTAAFVRQMGEDVVARLSFSAPADGACVTFRAGRECLRDERVRIAQRRNGAWAVVGHAQLRRHGNDVVIRASAAATASTPYVA